MNDKHLELIRKSCEVYLEKENAIWFSDCGFEIAEILIDGEWTSFGCSSKEEFESLCELRG